MNTSIWTTIPADDILQKTAQALSANGFITTIVNSGQEAKEKVLTMLPKGADVQANTSITLETIGLIDEIDKSGNYNSHRAKIFSLDMQKDEAQIRTLRVVADYALGSVHAVTQDGKLLIASNSGSNIPSDVFSAKQVIFVVGAQKIVPDVQAGERRIYEHCLPLETIRARKAYHLPDTWNSFVSKLLIYNKEQTPQRVQVILVKEQLGF